ETILQEGDIVSLDIGAYYKGYHGDSAKTHGVGMISEEDRKLIVSTSSNKSFDLYSDVYIEKYFNRDKVMEVNIEIDESDLKDMNE
ncbi:M24 family metallopeptidase, partial [Clostridioides difficile]